MRNKKRLVAAIILILAVCVASILTCHGNSFAAVQRVIINYTVQKGDTLWEISQKHNTTVSEIMSLNNLSGTTIYIGQTLKVYVDMEIGIKNIEYRVRPGNTLSGLAEYFGTTVDRIKSANGLTGDMIYVDQVLYIPASYVNYIVKPGDTLWLLANRFNTTIDRIRIFNALKSDTIYVGQVLHMPYLVQQPRVTYITHTVQPGETAWGIAMRYGIPQYELLKVNGLTESSVLSIGQKLKVPVYNIPVKPTPGPQYGEYLDWWTEAQYVFPIGKTARVRDFVTGKTFNIRRSIGANHADCEPLTASDATIMRNLWGGNYSWVTRAAIVEVDGRKIAASVTSMPHGVAYITNNNFGGHFDIHFLNSTRHSDGQIDPYHQEKVKIAAGIK
jgi:LysM repeat protein